MHDRGDRERGRGFDARGSSARSPDRQLTPEEEAIQRVYRVSQEIESAATRIAQLAAIVPRDEWRTERAKLQQTHDTLVENLKARELDAKTSARARDHYDHASKKLSDIATALDNAQEPPRPVPPVAGEEAIEPSIVARNASPDDVLAWIAGLDARERSAIAERVKTVLGSVKRIDKFAVDLANYLAGSRILPHFYKVAENPRKHFNAAAYAKTRARRDADANTNSTSSASVQNAPIGERAPHREPDAAPLDVTQPAALPPAAVHTPKGTGASGPRTEARGDLGGSRSTAISEPEHAVGGSHGAIVSAASSQTAGHGAQRAPAAEARVSDKGNAQAQQGPAGMSRPDLGNYDSPTGKHVLVLRTWDDTTIAARRVELQGRLSRTTEPKARDELLAEYQAIEWVARERGLSLPKDPGEEAAPQAYTGGKSVKFWVPNTAQGMRAMLEREVAASSGYESAREQARLRIDYGTLPQSEANNDKRLIGDQQIALMDRDAAAFSGAFQIEAKHAALSMLDASTVAIDSALRSYGIASGSRRLTDAAHNVARDPGVLDAEVDKWATLSARLDDNHAAYRAGHGRRDDLARDAKQLRDLQGSIAALVAEQQRLIQLMHTQHPQHPGMPRPAKPPDWQAIEARSAQLRPMQGSVPAVQNPFDQIQAPAAETPERRLEFVRDALRARRAQFQAAWIQAERQHPVLAAYRGTKPPDASSLADLGTDEAMTRSIVRHVLPKLGHIYRTKAALMGSWGTLDPLQLAPAVELTKQRMFVAQGSARDRVVHDMVAQAHDKSSLAQWALEAVMIGLTLVTLVPTAGASVAAGVALTGLAYDLYMGVGEHEGFQVMSAAADTDLDKLRSLSDMEPSLTPLLTRIVSAGVNLTVAAGLFKRAVGLRRMMTMQRAPDAEAVASLNRAGEEVGVGALGDEAVSASNPATTSTVGRGVQVGHVDRQVSIHGLASRPRVYPWTMNPDGAVRTLDEAVQIAQANGVHIPSDVFLRVRAPRMFEQGTYAQYFRRTKVLDPNERIRWEEFFVEIEEDDYIPISLNQDILGSDEAIVAVFAHETYEINQLRKLFEANGGSMTARQLRALIEPSANGKIHEAAWDEADRLVGAMRDKVSK